jgi:DNA-binding IclR family transcriptional regulator
MKPANRSGSSDVHEKFVPQRFPTSAAELDALPSPTGAKTLRLLDLLAANPAGVTAAEAARASGLTGNLVFRLLKTFVAMGFAIQHPDSKAYRLSSRLLDLSGPKYGDRSLVVCAHDALRGLRDSTGETSQLMIEAGGKGLVLEQVRGLHALQVSGRVGMRVPLYSCAPGKAILAWWTPDQRIDWFRGRTLKRFTPTTLATRGELVAELEAAKRLGYTVDRGEGIEGIHCVAAPVMGADGAVVAAVTVMGPALRLPETELARYGERCMAAARAIEERLWA